MLEKVKVLAIKTKETQKDEFEEGQFDVEYVCIRQECSTT